MTGERINEVERTSCAPRKRRWYQFSLRTLIVVIVLLSVLFGTLSAWLQRGRRQTQAVATIRKYKGNITYDYMSHHNADGSVSYGHKVDSPVPVWLIRWLGVDFFHEVVSIDADSGSQHAVWDAIGQFPEVTRLSVSGSSLQGPVDVTSLSKLRRLRSLLISGDTIRGEDLRCLQDAVDLESLWIQDSTFNDQGLQYLAALPKLTTLSFRYTRVGDDGLAFLADYPSLKYVDLSHTQVTDRAMDHLAAIPQLTSLALEGTKVTDAGAVRLSQAKTLRSLRLQYTQVTDTGLASLANLDRLEDLYLQGTNVTGEGVTWPDSLFLLDLRHSRLTEKGLSGIVETRNLRIMVQGAPVSAAAVERIQSVRPDLKFDYSR